MHIKCMEQCTKDNIVSVVHVRREEKLEIVIFNIVIDAMVDTLQTRPNLRFLFHSSHHLVNFMHYEEDACIIDNIPAVGQHPLAMVMQE